MTVTKTLTTIEMTQAEFNAVKNFINIISDESGDLFPSATLEELVIDFDEEEPEFYEVKIID